MATDNLSAPQEARHEKLIILAQALQLRRCRLCGTR